MVRVLIINNEKNKNNLGTIPRIKKILTENDDAIAFNILHYTDLSEEKVKEIAPDMIYLTGRLTYVGDLVPEEFSAEIELIRESDIPTLGVCAAHQLIALAYHADFGKMVEVPDDEDDVREKGFVEIKIQQEDEIFEGIEDNFLAYQWHRDEVKEIPENFELLASSEMCEVQAIKHSEKPLYGFQFHPERYDEVHPAGKIILQNFFNQAISK